jgi:hypothetical protein
VRRPCRGAHGATSCAGGDSGGAASLTRSVGAYFREDGSLAAESIKGDAAALLARLTESKSK